MKKPIDVSDGSDLRNHYKVVLYKVDEGELEHTELYYPTYEKAEEIATYLNNTLYGMYSRSERYLVKPHNPHTYVSYRKHRR